MLSELRRRISDLEKSVKSLTGQGGFEAGSTGTGRMKAASAPASAPVTGTRTTALGTPPTGVDQSIWSIVEKAATETGVSAPLIAAVIQVESGWNPNAVSRWA
jgi:soluble lytic murein transglycosylase-like protein